MIIDLCARMGGQSSSYMLTYNWKWLIQMDLNQSDKDDW